MEYFVNYMHIITIRTNFTKRTSYYEYTIRTKQPVNRAYKLSLPQKKKPSFRLACSIFLCDYYYMRGALYYNFIFAVPLKAILKY